MKLESNSLTLSQSYSFIYRRQAADSLQGAAVGCREVHCEPLAWISVVYNYAYARRITLCMFFAARAENKIQQESVCLFAVSTTCTSARSIKAAVTHWS